MTHSEPHFHNTSSCDCVCSECQIDDYCICPSCTSATHLHEELTKCTTPTVNKRVTIHFDMQPVVLVSDITGVNEYDAIANARREAFRLIEQRSNMAWTAITLDIEDVE
jgi:hypothetical protein